MSDIIKELGMDAAKWCAAMVRRGVVKADPAPGEYFHAWMYNAIELAISHGYSKGIAEGIAKGRADALRELSEKAEADGGYDAIDVIYILDQMLEALAQKPQEQKPDCEDCTYSDGNGCPLDCDENRSAFKPREPERSCETCRFEDLPWNDFPCAGCDYFGTNNHWQPKEGA
jgi:hypothetical protein